MASIVQTVTLAPAFLQEIKEDDRRLRQLLDQFRQFVLDRDLTVSDGLRLAALVITVRNRLAFHFALEEAYGYFEDPIEVAPRLCEQIDDLRVEHRELNTDMVNIAEAVETLPPQSPASERLATVQEMCREFLHRLADHESRENALIAQAFNEDVGVGD
jgi:iron-sulfur cluster repair protein YtfE (RIC family)